MPETSLERYIEIPLRYIAISFGVLIALSFWFTIVLAVWLILVTRSILTTAFWNVLYAFAQRDPARAQKNLERVVSIWPAGLIRILGALRPSPEPIEPVNLLEAFTETMLAAFLFTWVMFSMLALREYGRFMAEIIQWVALSIKAAALTIWAVGMRLL